MNTPGIPSTRWFDATLYDKKDVKQKDNIKAMFVMGHGGNTVTRMPQAQKGIEKLELLVVCDPHPTTWAHGVIVADEVGQRCCVARMRLRVDLDDAREMRHCAAGGPGHG